MINIIFIYLCFWVFISSCFIRWVVGLNCTPEEDHWIKNYDMTHSEFMRLPKSIRDCLKAKRFDEKLMRLQILKLEKELTDNAIKTHS